MQLQAGSHLIDLSRPVVMGILNLTPDSFSDGGRYYQQTALSMDLVLQRAQQMLDEGAVIIDVGGESTRPGAIQVSEAEELDRVVPVVEQLVSRLGAIVSVDTSSAAVIRESAAVGASIINDVRSLQRPGALEAAVASQLPVCLMHMNGEPAVMQKAPHYENVIEEVLSFLQQRAAVCIAAGIAKEKLIFDPGYGFGKNLEHNLTLLRYQQRIAESGFAILAGLSRKSLLGHLLGREVSERLPGSLALAAIAAQKGAHIIRVHDVAATVDVLAVYHAVDQQLFHLH
ncbi:dihydropteroate synthase [Cellvibrio polysaccharolyticus]|uniref:Dihydropteroate synthase n=1 Tax=Cellvibrio polysaccharolyticus TaxID=2082724 RepID=A0A928YTI0_9GAMM|nr:dihydropteroate synthase [Cellvibrio polysaccharolyticus]MBE8716877.1 dihydropteroate synthase [Cellvibrio polysaccharolyticus]